MNGKKLFICNFQTFITVKYFFMRIFTCFHYIFPHFFPLSVKFRSPFFDIGFSDSNKAFTPIFMSKCDLTTKNTLLGLSPTQKIPEIKPLLYDSFLTYVEGKTSNTKWRICRPLLDTCVSINKMRKCE